MLRNRLYPTIQERPIQKLYEGIFYLKEKIEGKINRKSKKTVIGSEDPAYDETM